ncbi:MAG: hypothetical protein LBO66_10250 [Deltaproteobacteria bacterium]|nr:hypothetical protein [Deltaproteobacteria bacterium]
MSVNSILYSQSYWNSEPALLRVGSKEDNYASLANYLNNEESLSEVSSSQSDQVDLALDKVQNRVVSDLASLTAETILEYPEFQNDYLLAIIDGEGDKREARVYSRQEIVESSNGTDEEKKAMYEALAKEPLLAYSSSEGLPASSTGEAATKLADKVNAFLTTNEKLLDLLDTYGFNPFDKLKL